VYDQVRMRAVIHSFLSVLVVAALFWGNCLSCPQVLLAARQHSCCPHGKGDVSKCTTQGLRSFVKAEKTVTAAPAILVAAEVPALVACEPASEPAIIASASEFHPSNLLPLRI